MTTPTFNDPFGLLQLKKSAELAGGAFTSLESIPPALRSRHTPEGATVELGLGYVQAMLAVLLGVVGSVSYDDPGSAGRVSMRSTGGSTVYHFSWNETSERLAIGGFVHGGHPTYQVAVIGLCRAIAAFRCGVTASYDEVVETWYALVRAMDRTYPRISPSVPWDKRTIAAACRSDVTRPLIVKMCDALRVALRYQLPSSETREVGVTEMQVLASTAGSRFRLAGSVLLDPEGSALAPVGTAPAAAPTEAAPTPPLVSRTPSRRAPKTPPRTAPAPHEPIPVTPAVRPTTNSASAAASSPAAVSESPPPPATRPALFGPYVARIARALERGGPVMLAGPTATGKTTQAKEAAVQLGMDFELITLDEGWDASELFGGYTRAGGDWSFAPGPVTRWANRVRAGETVVLIIDELARGHKSVVSAVMRV